MLTIGNSSSQSGQRQSRRSFLQLGALAGGTLNLADLLRLRSQAAPDANIRRDTAVIHFFMGGGPSHLDTFDLKPAAPVELRGEFRPIDTDLPGLQISEQLPHLSRTMRRLALIRSTAHAEASHLPASHWMVTGYRGAPGTISNVQPYCGSVVAKVRGANVAGLPPYVSIPRRQALGGPAYLGNAFSPFTTDSDPNADNFAVPNLNLAGELNIARLSDRQSLARGLDRLRHDVDRHGEFAGIDRFSREAFEIVTGARAQQAFDIGREDAATRDRYGRTNAGQRCLLARRLVEAGVTFVTVLSGGEWDTHVDNFRILKDVSLPPFDRALAALVADLYERGLDQRVLLLVSGEFGRTPTINKQAGRDHWPGAFSVLFAGGGLRVGQVIGATDSRGLQPITQAYSPGDVLATVYHFLGIDTAREFIDRQGRPLRILNEGEPIRALLT